MDIRKLVVFVIITLSSFEYASTQQKPAHKPAPSTMQSKPGPQTLLGIFIGPNLNYLDYYSRSTSIKGKNAGFHSGVFFQKNMNRHFAVQPSVLLCMRGGRIRGVDSTINATLLNIEMPIQLMYLHKHLFFGAGPDFSYGIRGILTSNDTKRNAYAVAESFERTLKRFEIGGTFSIGYVFTNRVVLTARFSPGFSNIYQGDGSAPHDIRAHTMVAGFSVGYAFSTTNN